jgi:hypothetical protein
VVATSSGDDALEQPAHERGVMNWVLLWLGVTGLILVAPALVAIPQVRAAIPVVLLALLITLYVRAGAPAIPLTPEWFLEQLWRAGSTKRTSGPH